MGLRTFVAIEVPGEIQASIYDAVAPLRNLLADAVKWVKPGNIHLTLKFLGETPDYSIGDIEAAISRAAIGIAPMAAEIKGVGAFPNLRRPSVFWVGLQCPPALSELKSSLENKLLELGIEADDKPFSPHMTVGRLRRGAKIPSRRLAEEMRQLGELKIGNMDIMGISLMKSDLRPDGPVYARLASVSL